jgi:hypothetical protein
MELLDVLQIHHGEHVRRIEIYRGDLTDLPPEQAIDVLVVSALPNDYLPTPTSLIGALARKGVSVAELARHKAADMRRTGSCWLSDEVAGTHPGIRFRRILCFEPAPGVNPPEVVGDIFRSLAPLVAGDPPVRSVALPLVATGDRRVPIARLLEPLLDAAVHWMSLDFPLERLAIVAHGEAEARRLAEEFARLKGRYGDFSPPSIAPRFDVFLSYSHHEDDAAGFMVEQLEQQRPGVRVFYDRRSLDAGVAWQEELYEAIDASSQFLAMLSPRYVDSKVCREEFNIALYRRRETASELLFPVLLYTADLPSYMAALVQYVDCREADRAQLRQACRQLAARI